MVRMTVRKNPQLEGTKTEVFLSAPGTSIPDDHALVESVIAAHRNQLGQAPKMGVETWYSDAAHMNRYGIPTVNYGSAGRIRTGGGGFSTAQGEHVHIGDMIDIVKVYIEVMLNLCGVAE